MKLYCVLSIVIVSMAWVCGCQPDYPAHHLSDTTQPPEGKRNDMFGTPLTRAIRRGLKPGNDLVDEIRSVGDYVIKSRKDAQAIVEALRTLPDQSQADSIGTSSLHCLTALFQDVESTKAPAFAIMADDGIDELLRVYDRLFQEDAEEHADDLMFILKIFAMYGSQRGCERIIQAARRPLSPDGYMWSMILQTCTDDHPHRAAVIRELGDPIPDGFIGIGLLDACNAAAIEGELADHPFDNPDGMRRLRGWLEDRDPDHFSYAHSATAALPFVTSDGRDDLLAFAMDHVDAGVQMEAAWAASKLGRPAGVRLLAQYCLDVCHSGTACRYLKELELENEIPDAAVDPTFQARSEFARWLAHPNELATPPDEVEVVDSRELDWPGHDGSHPFWLLRYRLRDKTGLSADDVGCGLVGSMTWCFFLSEMHRRPPEDCYAIHCTWEMQNEDLIEDSEVTDPLEYAHLLRDISSAEYQDCRVVRVAEVSPKLGLASRIVACANAKQGDNPGWLVLDANEKIWYPANQFPEEESTSRILQIHIGRKLLNFQGNPDRASFLAKRVEEVSPEQVVSAYERLLDELSAGDVIRKQSLLQNRSLLQKHLDDYLKAVEVTRQTDRDETLATLYERFLDAAKSLPEANHEGIYDSFTVLGENFSGYVEVLKKRGDKQRIVELIETFAPHWDHNLGYGTIGNAAFDAEQWDLAERYFLKLKKGMDSYVRCEQMSRLASIWHARGETKQAKDLILECMAGTLKQIRESKYNSDRDMFAGEYEFHRKSLIELSPEAQDLLAQHQLPADPLE